MSAAPTGPAVDGGVPLSRLLREGSRAEHTEAESSAYMGALLDGRVSAAGYVAYLEALAAVYAGLEQVGRDLVDRDDPDPVAAAVWDPALERGEAIATDLRAWTGSREPTGSPSRAVAAYVDRLHASAGWGGTYVAHHYTRYLGDLSGGQAIGRVLARTYDLQDGEGTAFYRFDGVPRPKPYKDAYRARLDALPLDAGQRAAVLDEVRTVFRLNHAVLTELSEDLDRWLVRPAS